MNESVYLIQAKPPPDDTFSTVQDEPDMDKQRKVFGKSKSAVRSEYYKAQELGTEIKKVFRINLTEYRGEQFVMHKGIVYRVTRDFEDGQKIELMCETLGARQTGR